MRMRSVRSRREEVEDRVRRAEEGYHVHQTHLFISRHPDSVKHTHQRLRAIVEMDAFLDDLLLLVFEHVAEPGFQEDTAAALCSVLRVSKRWHVCDHAVRPLPKGFNVSCRPFPNRSFGGLSTSRMLIG
jgi:hypothetical protein